MLARLLKNVSVECSLRKLYGFMFACCNQRQKFHPSVSCNPRNHYWLQSRNHFPKVFKTLLGGGWGLDFCGDRDHDNGDNDAVGDDDGDGDDDDDGDHEHHL